MPLASGKSKGAFISNVREIMHSFARTGKIGTSRPANKAKADKQAVAIAYAQKRRTLAAGR